MYKPQNPHRRFMDPGVQTNGQGGTQGGQGATPLLWDGAWWHFMRVCGIFPGKSHKNVKIAKHGKDIFRAFRLQIAPNKKTRQEVWYLNDTFPTFLEVGRSIQTDLQPNMFRYRNVSLYWFVWFWWLCLERTSTSPETLVCANWNSDTQRHESPLNTSKHLQKSSNFSGSICFGSFLKQFGLPNRTSFFDY